MAVHAEANCILLTKVEKTSLLGGHFLYKGIDTVKNNIVTTPSGAGIIQNLESDPANWGYNTWIGSNGIALRRGETVDALLSGTGLEIKKGGIIAGTYGSDTTDFIYLSTEDYAGPTITIGGNTEGWRQIIGNKFGVKNDGTLYAAAGVIGDNVIIGSGNNSTSASQVGEIASKVQIENGGITLGDANGFHIFIDGNTSEGKPVEEYTYGLGFYETNHNPYDVTGDTAPVTNKVYYIMGENGYEVADVSEGFESGVTYYEKTDKRIAFINENKLSIPYSVVLREMIVGTRKATEAGGRDMDLWAWKVTQNEHLRLVWKGGDVRGE